MRIQIRFTVRNTFSPFTYENICISLMPCRNGCSSHSAKDIMWQYGTLCYNLKKEREGYGTVHYKAKSCKQADDCTNSVNYEANEKLKGSSNEKFDQMLLRLSMHIIKWLKKGSPRYILACDFFHT